MEVPRGSWTEIQAFTWRDVAANVVMSPSMTAFAGNKTSWYLLLMEAAMAGTLSIPESGGAGDGGGVGRDGGLARCAGGAVPRASGLDEVIAVVLVLAPAGVHTVLSATQRGVVSPFGVTQVQRW